ncbi:MAG: iron-sulfur cluster assembly accessory protein [Gammaproteobacteria bacterium]|jgi:iron-sulfur cluster assembly protein|nr:iron-sulfur cluster assembly accessory protein [Gammaproteobacteria bacterium]MCW8942991.1 iron-sulfur cluster assembly accessory protein [Gammaproteobacteria bacterium]
MITVTPAAAAQIKLSADQGKAEGMSLRIAASRNEDNSIHYGMGFDDSKEDDVTVTTQDIEIILSASSAELLKDTIIDFVELEPEKFQFIFLNPNDPNYVPPSE